MKNDKLRFKRFLRCSFLRRIGRPLLAEFLARFETELRGLNAPLPLPESSDDDFFALLGQLLAAPEGLPPALAEALFAIDELSTAEGQEQLELAAAAAGLDLAGNECTRGELALRVWLAQPALLARVHNKQRLCRLTAFECFGPAPTQSAQPQPAPGPDLVTKLAAALDPWFARHQRGHNTTRIEVYPIESDYWFLVRHGDTFTRTPKVDGQQTAILHFRPERDDVIVYSPEHDELRINARTRGERQLYVETFGLHLRGRADWFCRRRTYTLEPLRHEGRDALDPAGLEGLIRITLRELELTSSGAPHQVLTRAAEDLFQTATPAGELIPSGWRLTRAGFDLFFAAESRPRPVQIRPPNRLKLGRHCDLQLVVRWLWLKGFNVANDIDQRSE